MLYIVGQKAWESSDTSMSTCDGVRLYIVGQKAWESSDTSMSTCDGVRHMPGHWKTQQDVSPTFTHRRM